MVEPGISPTVSRLRALSPTAAFISARNSSSRGPLATGRFLSYEGQGLNHNNLLVSILNALGIPDTSFGKADWCTGPLTGLFA